MSFRFPSMRRKSPSAIGLRQILPVQTKRTLFTIQTARASATPNPRVEPVQVNLSRGAAAARPTDHLDLFRCWAARYGEQLFDSAYPRGNCNLNLCQMYKTRIAPMMDTINPPR